MTDLAIRPLSADELVGDPRSARADSWFRIGTRSAGYVVLLILAGIAISTTIAAWPAFRAEGFSYLLTDNWVPTQDHYGALAIIYGTLVVSLIAIVVAAPISVGIALFITELAPRRLRTAITTVMDVLAAIPSVVFGLWAFLMLRPQLKGVYNSIADAVSSVPVLNKVFGPSLSGQSFMTAGLIVGLMITPIITSILREVYLTVPTNDKNGALALGATRWEMIRGVIFPHSTGGMVGAVMLGLGRAMGETIAVALVIGASPQIVTNLFAQGEAMPSIVARNLNESDGVYRSALIGLGVILFIVTILINVAARSATRVIDRRSQGAA
jgi:phosphate transport system permease protein